jgi:glucose/arabinose dehydrogenase
MNNMNNMSNLKKLGKLTQLGIALLVATVLGAITRWDGYPAQGQQDTSQLEEPFNIGVKLVAQGLTSPVTLSTAPDGSGRLFIVDEVGLIKILASDGTLLSQPFLDMTSRIVPLMPDYDERGLLGLAFHPGYATNGRIFVYYNAPLRPGAPPDYDDTATLSEFRVSPTDPNRADPTSERIILQIDKPQFNHNGGTIAFGPDGYLYMSIGDGGGAHDVGLGHVEDWFPDNAGGNGQDIEQNLLGSVLRLDVNNGSPYGIPADNPFVGRPGLDEIYAYGLRNPFNISFDMGGNHALYVGDAGQFLWEEVDIITAGGNYGWNIKEGTHCFDAENPFVPPATCPDTTPDGTPLLDPIIEYANSENPMVQGLGHVVVSGYVYRGTQLRQLRGRYVFGDWSTSEEEPDGSLFAADPRGSGLWRLHELLIPDNPDGRLGHFVLGFGQDTSGEMYVLTTDMLGPAGTTGKVFKLVRPGGR